jgi:hypothetical protein
MGTEHLGGAGELERRLGWVEERDHTMLSHGRKVPEDVNVGSPGGDGREATVVS